MDATERLAAISAKIEAGELPARQPTTILAGPSSGASCAGCDALIAPGTTEYEIEVAGQNLRMHLPCFAAWSKHPSRGG